MSLPFPFLLSFFLSLYMDCRSIEHARLRITLPLFYHHLHFDLLYHLLHPCLLVTLLHFPLFITLSFLRSFVISSLAFAVLLHFPTSRFSGNRFLFSLLYVNLTILHLYSLIYIVLTRATVHVAYPFLPLEDRTSVDDISHVELTWRERFSRSWVDNCCRIVLYFMLDEFRQHLST